MAAATPLSGPAGGSTDGGTAAMIHGANRGAQPRSGAVVLVHPSTSQGGADSVIYKDDSRWEEYHKLWH